MPVVCFQVGTDDVHAFNVAHITTMRYTFSEQMMRLWLSSGGKCFIQFDNADEGDDAMRALRFLMRKSDIAGDKYGDRCFRVCTVDHRP